MLKQKKILFAALVLIAIQFELSARAQVPGYERSTGGILMPRSSIRAGSFSEFSGFDADFCGVNSVAGSDVKEICFGRLRLQNQTSLSARAFLLADTGGHRALFVESEIPKVELRSLEFEIMGPLNRVSEGAGLGTAAEVGRARIAIDARGEVSAVELLTRQWGRLKTNRQTNRPAF